MIAFCRPWRGQLATKDWALTESEAQQAHFSAGGVRDVVQTRRKERIALAHTSRNSDAQLEAAAAKERQKLLQKQKQLEKQKLKPKPNQRGSGDAADELSVASGESRHHDLAHSHHQNEHNAPRIHSHGAVGILNRMQLNAARALNAQSKKFLADHYQVHARTNILQDQLLKEDRLLPHEENLDAEPEHKVQSANQLQEINHFSIDMSQEDALAASIAVAGVHTHVGNNPSKTALLVNSATDTMGRTMDNDDKAAMSRKARRKYVSVKFSFADA